MTTQPEYHAWKKRFVAERHHEPTPYDAWIASRNEAPDTPQAGAPASEAAEVARLRAIINDDRQAVADALRGYKGAPQNADDIKRLIERAALSQPTTVQQAERQMNREELLDFAQTFGATLEDFSGKVSFEPFELERFVTALRGARVTPKDGE